MSPNLALNRRSFLTTAAAAAFAPLGGAAGLAAAAEAPSKGFRFVHLSDLHIQKELGADQGVIKAFKAVEALSPKPDFILTGGDLVMDSGDVAEAKAKSLFSLLKTVLGDHTGIPIHHCVGNHDVFGWGQKEGVTPANPHYGKKMISEELGLEKTYHAFDHKGWRFYVLDTIQPAPNKKSYEGGIDPEQLAWLEADLKAKPAGTPAIVNGHIPILSVTVISEKFDPKANAYVIPAGAMCRENKKLIELFRKYNVKLSLSGHIHQLDRIDLNGISYICDGAVSGNWWKGPLNGVPEGFGIVDAKPDGTFKHEYHPYGWKSLAPES